MLATNDETSEMTHLTRKRLSKNGSKKDVNEAEKLTRKLVCCEALKIAQDCCCFFFLMLQSLAIKHDIFSIYPEINRLSSQRKSASPRQSTLGCLNGMLQIRCWFTATSESSFNLNVHHKFRGRMKRSAVKVNQNHGKGVGKKETDFLSHS